VLSVLGAAFPSIFVPQVRAVAPGIAVGKILIQRDESTPEKLPKMFYCKLPPAIKVRLCACVLVRQNRQPTIEGFRERERERERDATRVIIQGQLCLKYEVYVYVYFLNRLQPGL
jgi:hypothetical protein